MHSIALIRIMLYPTQCMQYCYYYKWINGIMNNVGLLGRTQCWLVAPKQPDVTVYDCDWAQCLFWDCTCLYFSKVHYFGAKTYKVSCWKKITGNLMQEVGQGSSSKLLGFSAVHSDGNTMDSLAGSKDHKLFRICFIFCLHHSLQSLPYTWCRLTLWNFFTSLVFLSFPLCHNSLNQTELPTWVMLSSSLQIKETPCFNLQTENWWEWQWFNVRRNREVRSVWKTIVMIKF